MNRYRFIRAERANYPVAILCRVVGVARAQADEQLAARIAAAHTQRRGTYGTPRIYTALRAAGVRTPRHDMGYTFRS